MTEPTLLPATEADHEAVAAIVAEAYPRTPANGPGAAWTPASIAAEAGGGARWLVARVGAEAVGGVVVAFPDDDTVRMSRLAVRSAWRGRGIGGALLRAVVAIAAGCGARRTLAEVDAAAPAAVAAWFDRLGFGADAIGSAPPGGARTRVREADPALAVPLFETPRLVCRRWRRDDLPALLAVYGDDDAMRWVGDGRAITVDDCRRWLRVTAINCATRGYGMFALDAKADGATVGFCGLIHPRGDALPEAKYALAPAHWGRGLASEALAGLLGWGGERGIATIIATVAEPNAASRRVVAKAGMRFVGLQEHDDDGPPTCLYAWGQRLVA